MNPRILAIIAAFAASFIYGLNHTIAKGLMPSVIQPYGFILLRVSGAAIVFWLVGLFYKKESIDCKDLSLIQSDAADEEDSVNL